MVEAGTIGRLLEIIEQRLSRLQRESDTPLEAYLDDPDLQDIVERNLEVCIQACIDLGLHVLADYPTPLPQTNRGVFRALLREEVLERDLAHRLEQMAGFRNVLAHGYTEVVAERVHAALGELDDIREYVARIADHVEEAGTST